MDKKHKSYPLITSGCKRKTEKWLISSMKRGNLQHFGFNLFSKTMLISNSQPRKGTWVQHLIDLFVAIITFFQRIPLHILYFIAETSLPHDMPMPRWKTFFLELSKLLTTLFHAWRKLSMLWSRTKHFWSMAKNYSTTLS